MRDASECELGQHEAGAELGDELLGGVGPDLITAGQIAGETMPGPRPVHEFVDERRPVTGCARKGGAGRRMVSVAGT